MRSGEAVIQYHDFFLVGGWGGGVGGELTFKQTDGSDLKVRRVGFFKKVIRKK